MLAVTVKVGFRKCAWRGGANHISFSDTRAHCGGEVVIYLTNTCNEKSNLYCSSGFIMSKIRVAFEECVVSAKGVSTEHPV